MRESSQKVIVEGSGKSKKDAFAAALNQIQAQIIKNTEDTVLRIEPLNINVLEAEERVWTEKFLFFFLPRQKQEFRVKLEVEVQCTRVSLGEISFTVTNGEANAIRIPLINKTI
ncbi:MAG: DUF4312 family protein [Streptococcaceae bacterium]|jgi:uncharacterized protein (TIGR03578 family)|nr:DUF4312 family protein [Streptococcaceae bacterium]